MIQTNDHHKKNNPRLKNRQSTPCVLVAEDDDEMRKLLIRVLDGDGYATLACSNGIDLFTHLEPFLFNQNALEFKAIIADIRMPGLTGLEILEDLHDFKGFPPMILITAFGDASIHARAEMAGVTALLDKPFAIEDLLATLHEILPEPS